MLGGHPRSHWQALHGQARLHGAVDPIEGNLLISAFLHMHWGCVDNRNSLKNAMWAYLVGTLVVTGRLWTASPGCMEQLTPLRATCWGANQSPGSDEVCTPYGSVVCSVSVNGYLRMQKRRSVACSGQSWDHVAKACGKRLCEA